MDYPRIISVRVPHVFNNTEISITLHSGLTTLVGTNGAGKTQTLKAIRNKLREELNPNTVRYLSSNRLGTMESFRSKVDEGVVHNERYFNFGAEDLKRVHRQIETATGDFFAMDERRDVYVKVSERLSKLFHRTISIRWDNGNMKVFFEKTDHGEEYSVVAEASGLINIISILAALYDDVVQVLLIDEPEVSLHPQLQAYLLREIHSAATNYGKTVIIATHSVEMIELSGADQLCNFVFFNEGQLPVQIEPDNGVLQGQKLKDFILRMGLVYHEGFFAKKIMLVEGVSDLLFCRFLCRKLDLNTDAAGTQLIPVDGKGQFPTVVKLFRLMNKEVFILTDLDGFTDDNEVVNSFVNTEEAAELAHRHMRSDLQSAIRDVKAQLEHLIQSHKPALKAIYEAHPYWKHFHDGDDEMKAVRRAVTAQLLVGDETLTDWPSAAEWLALRTQMNALFDALEELGCFVLRKGAIESYYRVSDRDTYDGKPGAAVDEIAGVQDLEKNVIEEHYSDIVRAVRFASQDDDLDESQVLKSELVSELAPVQFLLPQLSGMSREDAKKAVDHTVKQVKNGTKSIFCYDVADAGDRKLVVVDLESKILNVEGFPLTINCSDNIVQKVDEAIHPKH